TENLRYPGRISSQATPPSPVFCNCLRRAMNVAYVRLRLSAPNCSTLALGREMDRMVGRESGEGVGEHARVAHVDLGEAVIGQRLEIARVSARVDVETLAPATTRCRTANPDKPRAGHQRVLSRRRFLGRGARWARDGHRPAGSGDERRSS